jgi:hypothetical protein
MADQDDPIDFDDAMQTIDSFIQNLYVFFETGEMKKEHRPFVDCYTIVYKLADHKDHATELYEYHKNTIRSHLK